MGRVCRERHIRILAQPCMCVSMAERKTRRQLAICVPWYRLTATAERCLPTVSGFFFSSTSCCSSVQILGRQPFSDAADYWSSALQRMWQCATRHIAISLRCESCFVIHETVRSHREMQESNYYSSILQDAGACAPAYMLRGQKCAGMCGHCFQEK